MVCEVCARTRGKWASTRPARTVKYQMSARRDAMPVDLLPVTAEADVLKRTCPRCRA